MIPACLYLNLELSLCELYCNGYVLYPFIRLNHSSIQRNDRKIFPLNTFAASYLNTQGLNNSCLKSPASTLVDLTFQSPALRCFSLNQLRNLSL